MLAYALFVITPTLAPGKVQLLQRVCLQCLRRVSVFQDSVFETTSLQKLNLFQNRTKLFPSLQKTAVSFRLCVRQRTFLTFAKDDKLFPSLRKTAYRTLAKYSLMRTGHGRLVKDSFLRPVLSRLTAVPSEIVACRHRLHLR